jgi:AcrR family transcriptional regulator
MPRRRNSAETRKAILQAAQWVVARRGVAHLTLEAVAHEAGLSKGAVLYHFATKEKLVEGMLVYMVEGFNRLFRQFREADNSSPGAATRAYVRACLQYPEGVNQAAFALIAAVATNPQLLDLLRRHFKQWQRSIEKDGIDVARATAVRLATDGLWFCELFGFQLPGARLRKQVIAELMKLTRKEFKEKTPGRAR